MHSEPTLVLTRFMPSEIGLTVNLPSPTHPSSLNEWVLPTGMSAGGLVTFFPSLYYHLNSSKSYFTPDTALYMSFD